MHGISLVRALIMSVQSSHITRQQEAVDFISDFTHVLLFETLEIEASAETVGKAAHENSTRRSISLPGAMRWHHAFLLPLATPGVDPSLFPFILHISLKELETLRVVATKRVQVLNSLGLGIDGSKTPVSIGNVDGKNNHVHVVQILLA